MDFPPQNTLHIPLVQKKVNNTEYYVWQHPRVHCVAVVFNLPRDCTTKYPDVTLCSACLFVYCLLFIEQYPKNKIASCCARSV